MKANCGSGSSSFFVDKIPTGFLTWTNTIKAYTLVGDGASTPSWEQASSPALKVVQDLIGEEYYSALILLWGQETSRNSASAEVRAENIMFMKSIGECYKHVLSYSI
jgi:proteasome activator subunit 4